MILDFENMVSKEQALTVTANSTDQIDLGPNSHRGNSVGEMIDAPFFMNVNEEFAAAGAATLTISVKSSNADDRSAAVEHQSKTFAKADLTVGQAANSFHIPHDALRYLFITYTVATGPFSAGKITMGVATDRQTNG